jgi:hypothetical protein
MAEVLIATRTGGTHTPGKWEASDRTGPATLRILGRPYNELPSAFRTHWNKIEHRLKLRTKVTHGASSPAAAPAMAFKLAESAQDRWPAVTAAHLAAPVRTGAKSGNGVLTERTVAVAA